MSVHPETIQRLAGIPNLTVSRGPLLSRYTRFAIGGPAELLVDAVDERAFTQALDVVRSNGAPYAVIGGGTNLIVSDHGFPGIVLRYTARFILRDGNTVHVAAGAELQALVDFSIANGLRGLETMTGIPGWVGAAVYGNAGAYGHSINERIRLVRFFDGTAIRAMSNEECRFRYRESVFKKQKDWIVLAAELDLDPAPPEELCKTADEILKIRLEKYPLTMKCAGSIFKNLILAELTADVQRQVPPRVVREGKVPSAYFLEEVGAKGMQIGDIRVATYHANLIYNDGQGTARELRQVIAELKSRVAARFGLTLEEEVQYVGFTV
jgi:UDP-N-acetylmuramate dehydrogenase